MQDEGHRIVRGDAQKGVGFKSVFAAGSRRGQACARRQVQADEPIAILGDRNPPDQLHDEVWTARLGRTGVDDEVA